MSEDRLTEDALAASRLEKVEALREAGEDPYPVRFDRDATAAELHEAHRDLVPGSETRRRVSVAGRLMTKRTHGGLSFGDLQDWSGRIQLFIDQGVTGEERFSAFDDLDLGDWVGATGEVITTRKGELSVQVEEFVLLAKALRPLPEKWHGLKDVEQRYRRRYVDLVANREARQTALVRIQAVEALREAFERRGFLEVETPILQLQPGGALARPFVTHHNALDVDMYLRIATELHLKRLVVGGMERVFEIGRIFRNEGISPKYNPEFTMLEAYQAFADYTDMLELTEAVIEEVCRSVLGTTRLEYQGRPIDLTPPWTRTRYVEAVNEAGGVEFEAAMPPERAAELAEGLGIEVVPGWSTGKIIEEAFDRLVEPNLFEPTVVMDYPKEISPLARAHREAPALAERFEVIMAGWEVANAFSELNDPLEQRRRFEAQARLRAAGDEEAHPIDEDYLLALEYGLPPTGGLGIGVDRLVMVLADQPSIREVILFPHLRPT